MLSAQAMETLSQFRDDYETQLVDSMQAPCRSLASLRFDNNRYYLEQALQEFTEDEIKKNYVSDMVEHLLKKKIIRGDAIEIGRATDAIKILRHYLLTRPDV